MGKLMSNKKDEKVEGADECWWVWTEIVIALMNAYRLTNGWKIFKWCSIYFGFY